MDTKLIHPKFRFRSVVLGLLLATACASAPKSRDPVKDTQCGSFCRQIDTCLGNEFSDESKTQLCDLARCESGCRTSAKSPAGYTGAFQFAAKTWKGTCYPIFDKAGLERCKSVAAMTDLCCSSRCTAEMIAQRGIRHWPTCGR